ncbi:MAG: cupin domain-containing protein, partial [Pyrinomonadaceae bacterium]
MKKINLAEKFSLIQDHWNPRIAGELNGQYLKLVKFQGPFTWHHHENEDEMFFVVKGRFRMDYREHDSEREEWIEPGEFIVVLNSGAKSRSALAARYNASVFHTYDHALTG